MRAHYGGVAPDAPQRSIGACPSDHVSGTRRHTFGTDPDRFGALARVACAGNARRSRSRRASPGQAPVSGWGILERPWDSKEVLPMLYSILCYESEVLAAGRTRQEDDAMMVRLRTVQQRLKS